MKFLLLLIVLFTGLSSFTEASCINEKTKTQISKPKSFPVLDKSLVLNCTEKKENQYISYRSRAVEHYEKIEEFSPDYIKTLSLEGSKSIDDRFLGDDFDKEYVTNIPYLIKGKKNSGTIIKAFEIKRKNSTEALIEIDNSSTPSITFSCLDKIKR